MFVNVSDGRNLPARQWPQDDEERLLIRTRGKGASWAQAEDGCSIAVRLSILGDLSVCVSAQTRR